MRPGELVKVDEGRALRGLGSEDEPFCGPAAGVVRLGGWRWSESWRAMLHRMVAVQPD